MLLEQAEQNISHIKQHLRLLLQPTSTPITGTHSPTPLSPIAEPNAQVRFAPFISIAASSNGTYDKVTYPRTPYPSAAFKCPRFSSTPNQDVKSPSNCYPRCAIDFDNCFSTPTTKGCDMGSGLTNGQGTDVVSPAEVLQTVNENSPDLPTSEDGRYCDKGRLKNNTLDELEEHLGKSDSVCLF